MAWGSLLFKIEKQKDLVGEGKHNNNLFKYSDSLKPFALNKALSGFLMIFILIAKCCEAEPMQTTGSAFQPEGPKSNFLATISIDL